MVLLQSVRSAQAIVTKGILGTVALTAGQTISKMRQGLWKLQEFEMQ